VEYRSIIINLLDRMLGANRLDDKLSIIQPLGQVRQCTVYLGQTDS
jgi:hypothetical protein